jgi:hypothetical protein
MRRLFVGVVFVIYIISAWSWPLDTITSSISTP